MPPKNASGSSSKTSKVRRDASASTSNRSLVPGGPSQHLSTPTRRVQVSAACQHCRTRKTKCDALRPCTPCVKRSLTCQFDTERGETTTQASKRKYDEATEKLEMYEQLSNMIETRDEQEATEIMHWIRSGQTAEAIVRFVTSNDNAIVESNPQRLVLQAFLINLAHSTSSLPEVVRLAMSISAVAPGDHIPSPHDFQVLRNRIVHFSHMEALLKAPQLRDLPYNGAPAVLLNDRSRCRIDTDHDITRDDIDVSNHPTHRVPAMPWTTITNDDDAVSHLVSLFLVWINPTWRFVEADIFLLGMRSKQISSDFCSPFLVNSILAIASLQSEHDIAFSQTNQDRITRGRQFHDEAMRLWALEDNRPTLTNMQALCVLALESNYRAEDRLGLTLVPMAAQLDNRVPICSDAKRYVDQGVSRRDYLRVRLSVHWMIKCTHIIMRIAFMSGATAEPSQTGFPKIHEVFDDDVEVWTGYPLTRGATPHRPTMYLRERCRLAEIFQDIHSLILTKGASCNATVKGFISAADDLLAKMQHWSQRLPFELQYKWPMSIAIWELHASYLSVSMITRSVARTRLQQTKDSPTGQPPLAELDQEDACLRSRKSEEYLSNAIPLAHQSAQILRDFRKRYGLKITPAWLLQLQAVAAGILLLDPELTDPTTVLSPAASDSEDKILGSSAAFDEVFRCLLGTGVEVMVARAIARMTYHSALEQRIVLSRGTWNMLQIMSDTAWRPADVKMVKSTFPNFATTKGYDDNERVSELLSKWEAINI